MTDGIDVAVVTQDPWFGGGARRQTEVFCEAARGLGRDPRLFYLARDGVVPATGDAAYRSLLPKLDSLNQLLAARMASSLRGSRSLWVVATVAHYGLAAARSGRPYACWVGTSLRDEARGRVAGGLPASRRLAVHVNRPVLERIERTVLRRAAAVYTTSPASRRSVAAACEVPIGRVRLLPLTVDVARFRPEPDERWLARLDAPVVTFVGRTSDPRKNVPLLLDAFRGVRARLPAARLRLVGPPPTAGALTSLPAGVEVVGEVESAASELARSNLLVLPSFQEGFGIVVAEALASGVPAVVTPCGGPEDLVRQSGGGVVLSTFQPEELAAALVELLSDPERLLALRRRGRAYVEREHSPARLRELLAAAFAELDGHV